MLSKEFLIFWIDWGIFVKTDCIFGAVGKCQVGSQTLHVGESAQVTAPAKEADVVFVVEQLEENEEVFKNLVTPLVSTLTNDLKEKGIT